MSGALLDEPATTEVDRPLGPMAGRGLGWWGVIMTILTEGTLFGLLLFSYFYLWAQSDQWPQGGIEPPKLLTVSIRTVLLLGSSLPAQLAERAIKRGDQRRFMRYLVLTFLMAAVFLAGHVQEVIEDWDKFRPSTNAYGSLFYTITNLHALHLMVGMAFLLFLMVKGMQRQFTDRRHRAVEVVVLYWHFVDMVWVAVFSSLYLSVRLG
ncbi:MAG: Cytochrome c oxidase, subunit [Acidimicrobiia bacterium]|nr:Cytochrome c oxidase, subunit [Acidimicrobiia bacterium]